MRGREGEQNGTGAGEREKVFLREKGGKKEKKEKKEREGGGLHIHAAVAVDEHRGS